MSHAKSGGNESDSRWVEQSDMLIALSMGVGMTRAEAERELERTLGKPARKPGAKRPAKSKARKPS